MRRLFHASLMSVKVQAEDWKITESAVAKLQQQKVPESSLRYDFMDRMVPRIEGGDLVCRLRRVKKKFKARNRSRHCRVHCRPCGRRNSGDCAACKQG